MNRTRGNAAAAFTHGVERKGQKKGKRMKGIRDPCRFVSLMIGESDLSKFLISVCGGHRGDTAPVGGTNYRFV